MIREVTIQAGFDEELIVRKKAYRKPKPYPYDCICGNEEISMEMKPFPNLYNIFGSLSSSGSWLWWSLVARRNRLTNEVRFKAKDRATTKRITKGYKELSDLNLVLRKARLCYLINPQAVMPVFSELDKVRSEWDKFKETTNPPRASARATDTR